MSLFAALRTDEGILAVTGDSEDLRYEETRGRPEPGHTFVKPLVLDDRVLVAAEGTVELLQSFEEAIRDHDAAQDPAAGTVTEAAQEILIELRRDAWKRHREVHGEDWEEFPVPRLRVVTLAVEDGQPRMTYVSEHGDIEDHTGIGYDLLGPAEIFGYFHLHNFPLDDVSTETATLGLYTMIRDAAEFDHFDMEGPPRAWHIAADGTVNEIRSEQLDWLEDARREVKARVPKVLAQTAAEASGDLT